MRLIYFIPAFIVLLIQSNPSAAQSSPLVFYRNFQGKLLTEVEADSALAKMRVKAGSFGMTAARSLRNKVQRGDSTIYDIAFRMIPAQMVESFEKRESMIGKSLPSFKLTDLQGNKVNADDFKGKPLVINMWFTTCPPCIAEMPELNKIKTDEQFTEVAFLSITFENKSKVKSFLDKHEFDFQHLVDARAYCELFTTAYPINIFVNREGVIIEIMDGMPMIMAVGEKTLSKNSKANPATFIHALNQIK